MPKHQSGNVSESHTSHYVIFTISPLLLCRICSHDVTSASSFSADWMTNESIFKCSFPHQQKTYYVMQHTLTFSRSVRLIRTTTTLSQGWGHKNILYSWDEQKVPTFLQENTTSQITKFYCAESSFCWCLVLRPPTAPSAPAARSSLSPTASTTILQDKVTNLAFPYQLSGPFFPFHLLITKIKEYKLLLSNPVWKGRHIILNKGLKCPTVQPLVNSLWQKKPKPARNTILRLFFLIEVKKIKWT